MKYTMSIATTLDLTADIIDVRDIIERVEDLESDVADGYTFEQWAVENEPQAQELALLRAILEDLKGYGGDEQWEGDWYPVTLIRDSYFTDYAQELLEDCGDIPKNLPPYVHIDWEATARDIRVDYSATEIDGVTYWYR
jgi:hypothetical protein